MGVFEKYKSIAFPYRYRATLHIPVIAGGQPTDPKKAEGWLKTKLAPRDELIREAVAQIMVERGVDAGEAVELVKENRHLNGFKRDQNGIYLPGYALKANLKAAANIRWPKRRWGPSRKGTLSFIPEHLQIEEDRLSFGMMEPTGVAQRFVHTWRGSGISYEEFCEDIKLEVTVSTDWDYDREKDDDGSPLNFWPNLWLTAEQEGLGASRSQGFGRFEVIDWEPLPYDEPRKPTRKPRTRKA